MFIELLIGTIVILITVAIGGLGFWLAEGLVTRTGRWVIRPPHALRLAVVLMCAVIMVLAIMTASVWVWALTFLAVGVFDTLEPSVYFSIVAFTTLGFGDVLLPQGWRILGGMTAANGLMNMGLYTAMLVEILRRVRSEQVQGYVDE